MHPRCPALGTCAHTPGAPDWLPPHSPCSRPQHCHPKDLTQPNPRTLPLGALLSRVRGADTGPAGLWASQELAKVLSGCLSASQPHHTHVLPFFHDLPHRETFMDLARQELQEKPLPFPDRQFSQQYVLLLFSG